MTDLNKKFKIILDETEENLKANKDLEYVKEQLFKVYTMFLDEFDKIQENYDKKIDVLADKCAKVENKMEEIETKLQKINKDIYLEDSEEEFEITCPYCEADIIVDFSEELKEEISCPECNNIIELDWNNEEEGCSHNCNNCGHHHDDENQDSEEDDM